MTGAGSTDVRTHDGCPLCTLVRGPHAEDTVLADDVLVVMEPDVAPAVDVTVVPVAHIEHLTDLPEHQMSQLLARLRRVLSAVETACGSDDFSLVPGNVADGGHITFHIAATPERGHRHAAADGIGGRIADAIRRVASP